MSESMHHTGYLVERLGKDNLADLAELYKSVYGRTAPVGFFIKKYDTAYTGRQYLGFIAYNKDRVPIGYYGVIPCFLQYDGSKILSAQSADTMTHPQYRFKGLFVELSNSTFDLCRLEGIKLVFGFPNQHSFHGAINKLGWKITEIMDCFIIPVRAIPLERITRKLSFLNPLYTMYCKSVLKKYSIPRQNMINSVINDGYAGVYRDTDYMAYKTYLDNELIQLGQSIIWIKLKDGLVIGDITVAHDHFDQLITDISRLAARLGVNQIQFQISPHTTLHTLFAKRFKSVSTFPILFQDLKPGLLLDKFKFTFADIDLF